MKTFKQFIEAPKKPKGPSKTPATDSMKIKHSRERDALADKGKLDKERQSAEFKQVTSQQKSEIERAKHMKTKEKLYVSLEDIKE